MKRSVSARLTSVPGRWTVSATAVLGTVTILLTGCTGAPESDSGQTGARIPDVVHILSTTDHTGASAFAGNEQIKGIAVAIEEINDGFLGTSRIDLQTEDTAGNAQTAAAAVSRAVADRRISALLGTVAGAQSTAVAPIAQAGGLPVVFTSPAATVSSSVTSHSVPLRSSRRCTVSQPTTYRRMA